MPKHTPQQYAQAFYNVTIKLKGKEVTQAVENFVELLAKDYSISKAPAIIAAYEKIVRKESGGMEIAITAAHELDEPTINKISKTFGEKVEAVGLKDETLVGGIKIQTDDTIFDASIKTQLAKLKQELTA